ncbi:MAG: acyl--CoA ligase [Planctomycetaceae bacterium]|nr:acyl--CoA ligase [Planctomycetaceae bacterium]
MIRHVRSQTKPPLNEWRVDEFRPNAHRQRVWQEAISLAERLLLVAKKAPHCDALVTDSASYTYADLTLRVRAFSEELECLPGWRVGERVGIRLGNGIDYIAAFYGVLLARGVAVPLPVEQREDWIEHVLARTTCRWIVDRSSATRALSTGILPTSGRDRMPSDLAAVFFTSGSSGDPKGVMLSHGNLISNAASIIKSLPLLPTDRALAVLPFCHAYGNSVLQSHLLSGATLVISGSTTFPESLVDAMRKHGVTSFAGVPDLHRLLLRGSQLTAEAVPTLRYATVAGGALSVELTQQMTERLRPAEFFVMYGQTEATARLSCLPAFEWETRRGSIGRGIPDVTLEVVDERGNSVAPGVIGELRAAGPNIMRGYWNDFEATQQCLRDGWLHTGDLATVDDDGYIYLRGRNSQLLKIGGYRVHPAEIEAVISARFPICDPVVVPYNAGDGMARLAMFLTPAASEPIPSVNEVRHFCQESLPRHQRPDIIEVLETPPLTASLKVDRQALSRMATGNCRTRSVRPGSEKTAAEAVLR